MRVILTTLTVFLSLFGNAQSLQATVFVGTTGYQGDLAEGYLPKYIRPAAGLGLEYEFSDRFTLRSAFTYGKIEGHDKKNGNVLKPRNLHFATNIFEFSLTGEYSLLSLDNTNIAPYVFAGFGFFNFDPYTKDRAGNKIFLKPLSTEGQGLSQYPDRKPYQNTQLAIPFGGGVKYALNDNMRIGFELGIRKLFTDYLDDVSSFYADEADLLAARGPKAVELAYRGDELPGGNLNYPSKGDIRGGADQKDWYYFTGIRFTIRLGGGYSASNANSKRNMGCPSVAN
jgi:hypothetical protein